ncbi:MAG: hypothetical protein SOH81_00655 [Acetobacter sp.]|jgi:hypothetical protein
MGQMTTREAPSTVATDIFREVNDDVRAERIRLMARRYAAVAAGVVMVGAIAGGILEYRHVQNEKAIARYSASWIKNLRATEDAVSVTDTGLPLTKAQSAALEALDTLSGTAPDKIATLARMQAAALDARHGKIKAALDQWNKVATDENVPQSLRDAATLFWCQWQIDSGDPATLRSRLSLLTGKEKPWAALADESLAALDLRQGHLTDAQQRLKKLSLDGAAPQGVRMRAGALLQTMNQQAG